MGNEFNLLSWIIHGNLDVLLVSETKTVFLISSFNGNANDVCSHPSPYSREDIPATPYICLLRVFLLEYIWGKQNELLEHKIQTYRQKSKSAKAYAVPTQYMNFIFLGNPNTEPTESAIRDLSILITKT